MQNRVHNFVYPKSAIGRALLFLFTFGILRYVCFFVKTTIFIVYNNLTATKSLPDLYVNGLDSFENSFKENFITSLINDFQAFLIIYLDTIVTMAIFAFIAYIVCRYLLNRTYGHREAFISMIVVLIALSFFSWGLAIYYNIFPYDDQSPDYLSALKYTFEMIINFAIGFIWLYYLFKLVPFGNCVSWTNGIPTKAFFVDNFRFIRFKCFQIGGAKIVLILLIIIIAYMLRFSCTYGV